MNAILKITSSLALAALTCQAAYLVMNKGWSHYYSHQTERLTELLEKRTPHRVLFIGSSRTYVHVNPAIIDSVCHTNSYNGGADGGNLYEFNLLLEAYLVHHAPPAYLVLTLDVPSFDLQRDLFSPLPYIPFTGNKAIGAAMRKNGFPVTWYSVLPFLRLTAYDDAEKRNALAGLMGDRTYPPDRYQYKGYLSNITTSLAPRDTAAVPIQVKTISDNSLRYLSSIIRTCRRNNTRLILTYAPEYEFRLQKRYSDYHEVFALMRDVATRERLTYWRHDSLSLCTDPGLFANAGHLNAKGADVYSSILATQLKELMDSDQASKADK